MDGDGDGRPGIRLAGVAVVITGALLVLAAFRFLDWYRVSTRGADSAGDVTFGKLRSSADQLGGAGVARAYFHWLAWVLLITLILVGVSANIAGPYADALRVAGFLLGLVGAGATYYALAQHFNASGSKHTVFHNATWGMWAALIGFLVGAGGAVLGPRRGAVAP